VRPIDDERVRESLVSGLTFAETARRLGCGKSSVARAAVRLGMESPERRGKVDVALLFQLWYSDLVKDEIARRLGISVSHLSVLKNKHHLPKRSTARRQCDVDPTPEQIEERAAWCRARRVQPEKAHPSPGIRQYRYSSRTGVFTAGEVA